MTLRDEQTKSGPAVGEEVNLADAIAELKGASEKYQSEYFGHLLNEHQVDEAGTKIAEMGTAATHLYDFWQRSRESLPSSAEIGSVVAPLTFRAQMSRWRPFSGEEEGSTQRSRFTQLAHLNESVRKMTEAVTEALPVLRDQVLYARHFERNCMRLYMEDREESSRLRYAEDLRLTLEQTLQNIQGDVDSLRAQTQSLTLYAQMYLAIQVQFLTWIILVVTIVGVVAALLH